jgi:hypothetical protein
MSSSELRIDVIAALKDEISGQIGNVRSSLDTLKGSTEELANSYGLVIKEGKDGTKVIEKVGTASEATAKKTKSFASSMGTLLTGLSTVALSAINLARNYRDLNDKQISVNSATIRLTTLTKQLADAHEATQTALKKFGPASKEYQDALAKENLISEKVENQKLKLTEANEALGDSYTNFAVSIIPTVISALGVLATSFEPISQHVATSVANFKAMTTTSKLLAVAMRAIPIVAIAAAFLAIRDNTLGFRDALDELGKKVGDMVPDLKPFLKWLKDLGEALGLTGKALDLKKAWQLFVDGFNTAKDTLMKTDWNSVLSKMVSAITKAAQTTNWAQVGQNIILGIKNAIIWTKDNVGAALKEFVTQAKAWASDVSNWKEVGKGIVDGIMEAAKASAVDVGSTGFMAAMAALMKGGGLQTVLGEEEKGGSFLDKATSNFDKIMSKGAGGTGGTAAATDTTAVKAAQAAWSAFSTSMATYTASITTKVKALQTAFSSFSTSVTTYANSMKTNLGTFFTTVTTQITALQPKLPLLGTAFTTLGTTITTAMTAANTQVGVFVTTLGTQFAGVGVKLTTVGTAFTTLSTTITTQVTAMNTSIGLFVTNLGTQFAGISVKITGAGVAFTTLSTTIKTQVTAMNTSIGLFVTNLGTQFTKAGTTIKTLQSASSTLSTTVSSHMKSMSTHVTSFAGAVSTAMAKATNSMKAATTAANALKKSIDALKSKTITITTRYVTSGSPGGAMHGGQWMSGGFQHGGGFFHAQGGFSGMVNRPTTFKGGRMGEGFRPELVTVTPLTRGTGNHTGPTVSGGSAIGGGGDQIINITVMLDGRVIQRFVEKTALAGIGVQI